MIKHMQREALERAPWTCEGIEGSKLKGDKGGDSFASQARNCKQTVTRVPLSPFWIKRIYKFNKAVFANFKIPFTRKSWLLILGLTKLATKIRAENEILKFARASYMQNYLLKFDFTNSLAQILEPKQIRSVLFYFAFYKITKTLAKWEAKCLMISCLQSWHISQHSYLCFLYSPFLHFGI